MYRRVGNALQLADHIYINGNMFIGSLMILLLLYLRWADASGARYSNHCRRRRRYSFSLAAVAILFQLNLNSNPFTIYKVESSCWAAGNVFGHATEVLKTHTTTKTYRHKFRKWLCDVMTTTAFVSLRHLAGVYCPMWHCGRLPFRKFCVYLCWSAAPPRNATTVAMPVMCYTWPQCDANDTESSEWHLFRS